MNFKSLNESLDRMCNQALTEGAGAGYTIKSVLYDVKVNKVTKVTELEMNTYRVQLEGIGTVNFAANSYEYGTTWNNAPVVIKEVYVTDDLEYKEENESLEEYFACLIMDYAYKNEVHLGGGYTFIPWEGDLCTPDEPMENDGEYATLVQIIYAKVTDEDIIMYVNDVFQGEAEYDDIVEESCSLTKDEAWIGGMSKDNRPLYDRLYSELGPEKLCGAFAKELSDDLLQNALTNIAAVYGVGEEDIEENLSEARHNYGHEGPFWYYSKHGIGPGMLPKDVTVVDIYEDDDFNTWIALDSVLTTAELDKYELKEQKPPIK